MEGFSTFKGHTAHRRASLIDLYLHDKFHWNWRNFFVDEQMYVHTYGDGGKDRHLRPALLGRLCRPKNEARFGLVTSSDVSLKKDQGPKGPQI